MEFSGSEALMVVLEAREEGAHAEESGRWFEVAQQDLTLGAKPQDLHTQEKLAHSRPQV